jgi:phosphoribosylformylglycinamidine synthase
MVMLWHIQITRAPGQVDHLGNRLANEAAELGLAGPWSIRAARGFLVEGAIGRRELEHAAEQLFVDPVAETFSVVEAARTERADGTCIVHVLPKSGVTDPEAESALQLLRDLGYAVTHLRTIRTYRVGGARDTLPRLIERVLANDAVEQAVIGALPFDHLGGGEPYRFRRETVPVRGLDSAALVELSRLRQLSLSLAEMTAIAAHFTELGRDPTDCELETIAQTWSEHCSHKTLKGRIALEGRTIDNLLKETIFRATRELACDWLVSVFQDNAGVIRFDDEHDVCFKVETHNHPSAIDPYGGANTGLGGVIRDALGTGLGARPICSTDVFCVASPALSPEAVPPGVLHPKRVLRGVVAGVGDYGNRMGIPTVSGAVAVDPGYLANPLVFCGTVGVLPRGKAAKRVEPGDRIVAIGGRTGRDGIHGATFSSVGLSASSESLSGGAVQIGNAITERIVQEVVIQARDGNLFHSITDCGAGGFSSAIGEMGAELGATVELDRAPLKYEGLSYTEIWISEAQERMVLAVPDATWPALCELCRREGALATDLGRFVPSGRLTLRYLGEVVADLSMAFLHEGRPPVVREATASPPIERPIDAPVRRDFTADLLALLAHWDVCSKEWIIRQYDHEVQAATVVKPLIGCRDDGPGDAAVVLPVRGSTRGLAVACGINPRYGVIDPYAMAGCVIDEAVRNCIAVGADPERIALLDNFCWGNTERPETLGSLVRAAQACYDTAVAYRTPFISGKDSLNNEFAHEGRQLVIPPTLLISAIGIVPDIRSCVTMDLKEPGNALYVVGMTRRELGGSIWSAVHGHRGGSAPRVDLATAPRIFRAVSAAIARGLVRSCHDASEGGLAVALAEMAFAGGLGASISLDGMPSTPDAASDWVLLFSESPTRFVLEARPGSSAELESLLHDVPYTRIGRVEAVPAGTRSDRKSARLAIRGLDGSLVVDAPLDELKAAWQQPLAWS